MLVLTSFPGHSQTYLAAVEKNQLFSTAVRQIWEWPGKDTSLSLKNSWVNSSLKIWMKIYIHRQCHLTWIENQLLGYSLWPIDLVCYNCCAVQPTSIKNTMEPEICSNNCTILHWTKVYICYWHCVVMKVVKLYLASTLKKCIGCVSGGMLHFLVFLWVGVDYLWYCPITTLLITAENQPIIEEIDSINSPVYFYLHSTISHKYKLSECVHSLSIVTV